jgi:heptose I phosphotransferase
VIEGMEAAVGSGREVRALHVIDAGDGMMVNERFAPVLAEHELLDFAALVRGERAEPMDYNRTKRLYRYRVGVNGHAMTLYMKQQRTQGSALAMTRWLRNADAGSPTQEWENLLAMQRAGLPTADPVAAGHRQLSDGSRESFVMTLGLHDYRPLDDVCRERFAARLDAATLRYKRALIRAAADLTRRLHASGFNHRDYYLCHMFVREGDGPPTLRLIDLQRCGWWWHVPYRYRVKDLAALHYSSLATPLTDRDRVRFFLWYAGERRRDPRWRQLIVDVLRKSRTIARHDSRRWAASTV